MVSPSNSYVIENGNSLSVISGFKAIPAMSTETIVITSAAMRIMVGKNNLLLLIIAFLSTIYRTYSNTISITSATGAKN